MIVNCRITLSFTQKIDKYYIIKRDFNCRQNEVRTEMTLTDRIFSPVKTYIS